MGSARTSNAKRTKKDALAEASHGLAANGQSLKSTAKNGDNRESAEGLAGPTNKLQLDGQDSSERKMQETDAAAARLQNHY